MNQRRILKEILEEAMNEKPDEKRFRQIKRSVCKKYHVSIPRNYDLYKNATKKQKQELHYLLLKKPTRSISGVSVVAVMCKPHKCPHGTCIYCPKGDDAPQSYTGEEPAALRARKNRFNPAFQVRNRLDQLKNSGHPTDKIELIIMGGTFPSLSWQYQKNFVRECLNAISGAPGLRGSETPRRGNTLKSVQKAAETSKRRPIGITIETRPDYCKEKHIKRMLELGATRVELGVQTVYDSIFKKIHRGHTVKDVVEATRLLKDSYLKVCYHIMLGLPGSNFEKDLQTFKEIFTNSKFMPDMIKIYPTLVMPGTELFEEWKKGKYEALTSEKAAKLVSKIKPLVPEWVRIMRVQRDIPANLIAAGVKKSNLRQLAEGKCKCIRCREVGHMLRKTGATLDFSSIELKRKEYSASNGKEVFLSYEDTTNDMLVGFLRLRNPSKEKNTAGVRELHVYGSALPIGKSPVFPELQHRGYGQKLLLEAERICKEEWGKDKLIVLSGIGAREYYYRRGYILDGFYVSKAI